jgi:hypothetical protein
VTQIQQQTNSSATASGGLERRCAARPASRAPRVPVRRRLPRKAILVARFSQPGTYAFRATANDGSLSTTSDVTIVVEGEKRH